MKHYLAITLIAFIVPGACDDQVAPHDHAGAAADTTAIDTAAPDTAEPPRVIPAPPEGGQQLLSDEYTLQPGEEKYFCYTFDSPPEEVGVVAVENSAGKLMHHVALFQSLGHEQGGFHECNVLIRLTWMPIWAGGRGANDLALPPGVAFKVPGKTQYVVQYHLLNAGIEPISERSAINLTYVRDLDNYQPAGIFALGQFQLMIPKDAVGYTQEVGCVVDQDIHVFAAFPHMHTLGEKLELFQGKDEHTLATAYKIDPWPFGDQPFDKVDFDIKRGDYIRSRCTWDNHSGHDVGFGESTHDEMCFLVLFAYPMPEISGCGFL